MYSFRIIDWQKKSRQKVSTPPVLSSRTHVIFEKLESPKKDFLSINLEAIHNLELAFSESIGHNLIYLMVKASHF